ncbi:MAG: exo-alpha-sialidase, partial [Planctomycetaceae bacterium]|nr:exo-alpha-sialidase [Planctomycetaceae bacterium]
MPSLLKASLLTLVCGGLFAWLPSDASAQGQSLLYTVPFQAGDGRYLIYRIPAIWTAMNKPLLAFAEGRASKRRAAGNIDIVL